MCAANCLFSYDLCSRAINMEEKVDYFVRLCSNLLGERIWWCLAKQNANNKTSDAQPPMRFHSSSFPVLTVGKYMISLYALLVTVYARFTCISCRHPQNRRFTFCWQKSGKDNIRVWGWERALLVSRKTITIVTIQLSSIIFIPQSGIITCNYLWNASSDSHCLVGVRAVINR